MDSLDESQLADLNRTVDLEEAALALTPPDSPDLPERLGNLANTLSDRFALRGDPADLNRAIVLQEEAVALTPAGSPDRPMRLGNLAITIWRRYGLQGDPTDLDRTVDLEEEALARTPTDSPEVPNRLGNLAISLSDRFDLRGDPADLDRAVDLEEAALARTPPESTDRPRRLGNLASSLSTRYDLRGDPADLDRAVDLQEAALARTPPESTDRPMRLGNLAISLATRYALRGDPADLDRAVDLEEAALARTPPESTDLPGRLGNLAIRLSTRYALRGDPADLDRAVDLQEAALARTPPDSPDLPKYLGNLAIRLSTRYDLRGDPADLDRAVDLEEAALARTPPDSPDLPGRLGNLASSLATRYDLRGDPADLDRAVDLEEAAWGLVRTLATGLGAIDVAWGLASRLRARDVAYGQVGASAAQQADTLSAGVATLDSILARAGLADDRAADTLLDRYGHLHAWRVEALLRLATDARGRGDDDAARQRAGEAYEAVALAKGRRLSARLHAGALAPTGAAATLVAELDRLATELDRLDQQLSGTDTGPDAVLGPPTGSWLGERATPAGTAAPDRYRGARARHDMFDDRVTDLTPQHTAQLAALRADLLARQTSLLRDIQALDPRWATARGTVTPPSVNEVSAALPRGGVAMLLFPTPDTTAVVTVRRADVPGEDHDPTVTLGRLPWPTGKVGAVEAAVSSPRDVPIPDGDRLERLLRDLGGDLGPLIVRTLGPLTTPNRRPSLVLMPTGTLHRVPFHAIPWMADGTTWDGTTRLADVARVSYVATPDVLVLRAREAARGLALGALAENHETAPAGPEVAHTTLAAVAPGVADASGGHVPNLTVALAHATAQLVPSESRARVTTRARATRHALLGQAALAGVGLALVATHGRAGEETGGRQSGLLLHADHGALPEVGQADLGDARGTGPQGTWVTAGELLARLPLDGTRHVQLLACETHADSPAPGDELAGLVSTFLIRGAASVAGTLWPVNEVAACLVGWWLARAMADGATPANAFHGAIYRLRHAVPGDIVEALHQMRPAATSDNAALAAVDACRDHFLRTPPHWRPFESPVHWAAYVFHGDPN